MTNTIHLPKSHPPDPNFKRIVEGRQEKVSYPKDSSVRLWVNREFENYPDHWHNAVEMIMPVDGGYHAAIGSRSYSLSTGDILIIPAGELHALTAPKEGVRLILLFELAPLSEMHNFPNLLPLLSFPLHFCALEQDGFYLTLKNLILGIYNEYMGGDAFSEFKIYASILQLCAEIGRKHMENSLEFSDLAPNKQSEYINKFHTVFQYINAHYMEPLTLEQASKVACFSKYHFSRLFKQYTGTTFYDYLTLRRIRRAEELLSTSGYSVTDVALASGFSSIATFNRTFKKLKGCTPTEYWSLCRLDNRRH